MTNCNTLNIMKASEAFHRNKKSFQAFLFIFFDIKIITEIIITNLKNIGFQYSEVCMWNEGYTNNIRKFLNP